LSGYNYVTTQTIPQTTENNMGLKNKERERERERKRKRKKEQIIKKI